MKITVGHLLACMLFANDAAARAFISVGWLETLLIRSHSTHTFYNQLVLLRSTLPHRQPFICLRWGYQVLVGQVKKCFFKFINVEPKWNVFVLIFFLEKYNF